MDRGGSWEDGADIRFEKEIFGDVREVFNFLTLKKDEKENDRTHYFFRMLQKSIEH